MNEYTRVGADSPSDWVTDVPRHAGRVKRYHTWLVHHQQSVGEHCWQVALVYEQIFGPPSAEVERYIRHHDTAELIVGDPPFPVKAAHPALKQAYDELERPAMSRLGLPPLPELPHVERVKVKVCDLLEMMELGMTEREMGNMLAVPVVIRTERYARTMLDALTPEDKQAVHRYVRAAWARHERVLRRSDVDGGYHQYATVD